MKTQRGFTLVELLVVIVIIVILSALLFPAVVSMRAKARKTETEALLTKVDAAIRRYKQDKGHYPAGISSIPAANAITTNCINENAKTGLYGLLGAGGMEYLTDELADSNLDSATKKIVKDTFESDNYATGAPIVYAFYTDTTNFTGWPSNVNGPNSGFKREFQLWSLGPDGTYGTLGATTGDDKDNITVTAYK